MSPEPLGPQNTVGPRQSVVAGRTSATAEGADDTGAPEEEPPGTGQAAADGFADARTWYLGEKQVSWGRLSGKMNRLSLYSSLYLQTLFQYTH